MPALLKPEPLSLITPPRVIEPADCVTLNWLTETMLKGMAMVWMAVELSMTSPIRLMRAPLILNAPAAESRVRLLKKESTGKLLTLVSCVLPVKSRSVLVEGAMPPTQLPPVCQLLSPPRPLQVKVVPLAADIMPAAASAAAETRTRLRRIAAVLLIGNSLW